MERTVVALSFDNGMDDTFHAAYKITEKYGIKSTVHITTGLVNGAQNGHK
ncbi:MAG: polysaccharide deacetylase family protein [Clostridia bacterium]|nr:polysaccharide deacetylase family protein [Clostridia bacterium]